MNQGRPDVLLSDAVFERTKQRVLDQAARITHLERVRACAEKYLRLVDQGGEDCGPCALRDETNEARTRLRYALKGEPLPVNRGR